MSIRKITINTRRNGYQKDSASGKYYSYEIDFYVKTAERDPATGKRLKKRHREKGFRTRADAETAIANVRAREKENKFGQLTSRSEITLQNLFDTSIETIKSDQEKTRARRVLYYFLDLLPPGFLVTELSTNHLRKFLTARGACGVKPQTASREMTTIATCLHQADELFPVELASWKCPRIPRPKMSNLRRERFVTDEEQSKILSDLYNLHHARPRTPERARRLVGLVFEFAHLSGARHGEICALRRSYYNRDHKRLKIVRTKTDSVSYLEPLTRRMMEILDEAIALNERSDFIFTSSGEILPRYYPILKEAAARAGVPYGRNTPDGIVTHDARHTFTTRLQQHGVDIATIQSFTGHSDREMVLRYSHARPDSRARAMRALEGENQDQNLSRERLREIFEKIQKNAMNLEEFIEIMSQLNAPTS